MLTTPSISDADARLAWRYGVDPLIAAFPHHAGAILRAIAFSHRDLFPVPVFVTGRAGAGKSTLAQAIAELVGLRRPFVPPQLSLASIRKAAEPGRPLIVDDAAPAGSRATPSMFTQIGGEVYVSAHSPLRQASLIVATGEQKMDPLTRNRVLLAAINRRTASREIYAQSHADDAASARATVHAYLQSKVASLVLNRSDEAIRQLAVNDYLPHDRRRNAALHVGASILRALSFDAGAPTPRYAVRRTDEITACTRVAIHYALANGASFTGDRDSDWILGRRDPDFLYVIPSEVIAFIRAELGDEALTTNAVAKALEESHYLYPSGKQGRSIPRSVNGTLTRVWRLSPDILD